MRTKEQVEEMLAEAQKRLDKNQAVYDGFIIELNKSSNTVSINRFERADNALQISLAIVHTLKSVLQ